MTYIGIDPGKSGAIAIIGDEGIGVYPFDEKVYVDRLLYEKFSGPCVCCLEHVHSMPKQGVTSSFNFGLNFGWIQGVLQALCIRYELVHPQKWKKEFSITADKNTSIEVCHKLFPDVNLKRTDKCKKDDDGFAEALLIAEYARRHMNG
jgi:crossover junction endodeoxyribonuclease RuvC